MRNHLSPIPGLQYHRSYCNHLLAITLRVLSRPKTRANRKKKSWTSPQRGRRLDISPLTKPAWLALQHARDNRGFYGWMYARRSFVWEVVRQEETEDFYEIRLSYRTEGEFRGEPGFEQFTIDKTGPITLRQIISRPRSGNHFKFILIGLGSVIGIGAVVGGLAAAGVFSGPTPEVDEVTVTTTSVSVMPDTPVSLDSFDGKVTVQIPAGTVDRLMELQYETVKRGPVTPPSGGL